MDEVQGFFFPFIDLKLAISSSKMLYITSLQLPRRLIQRPFM